MKSVFLSVALMLVGLFAFAKANSNCQCQQELEAYYNLAQKNISFLKQFKGREQVFTDKYRDLMAQITCDENAVACFTKIAELSWMIVDEHAYPVMTTFDYGNSDYKNEVKVNELRETNYFKNLERTSLNIDSLTIALKEKPRDVEEGYYPGNLIDTGIFKDGEWFKVVVLRSSTKLWDVGQIKAYIKPYKENAYFMIAGEGTHAKWRAYASEHFIDGMWVRSALDKQVDRKRYDLPDRDDAFYFKQINDQIAYLKASNFQWQNGNKKTSDNFISNIKMQGSTDKVIFDLRNNGGGSSKVSAPYIKLLKKFARNGGKVAVLINTYSASQAEITTAQLAKIEGITIMGNNSIGVLTYGINYDGSARISDRMEFGITDMVESELLVYERLGFPVEVKFSMDRDWIKQAIEALEN